MLQIKVHKCTNIYVCVELNIRASYANLTHMLNFYIASVYGGAQGGIGHEKNS